MILVTGGAGFIGANIVTALQDREPLVVCDSWGSDDKWQNLRHARVERFVFPEEIGSFLDEAGSELSAVIHMGAISTTTERDVDRIVRSNLQLSHQLWAFCTRRGIPFIYASSAATYGDGSAGFDDLADDAYLARLRPLNPYGWSKLAFDRQIVDRVRRAEPQPPVWAGLKFFNVYGPREQHKGAMRSVATAQFDHLRGGGALRLFRSDRAEYADGGQLRDFVFVDDCVAVIEWMLDNRFAPDLYNIGTGRAQSWLDLAGAMFAALDRTPAVEFIAMPGALVGKYQYYTQANMTKLAATGAPLPQTSLADGVRITYGHLEAERA